MIVQDDRARHDIDETIPHKRSAQTRNVLRSTPDKVVRSHGEYWTGLNASSGKRWFRWETVSTYGFYRNAKGTVIPFYMVDRRNMAPSHPIMLAINAGRYDRSNMAAVFSDEVGKQFGIKTLSDLYPIAGLYDIQSYNVMPSSLRGAMRATDMREFTAKAFGKSNVRKDLIKACANAALPDIAYVREFRNLVPVDWMVNFLREQDKALPPISLDRFRELLAGMDPRSYRSLLRNGMTQQDSYMLEDILRYRVWAGWNWDRGNLFRKWTQAHDALLVRNRQNLLHVAPFEDGEIKLCELGEKISDLPAGKFIIRPAKHTSILNDWGQEMSNCIGSYKRQAQAGDGIYAGVYEGDNLKANLEIRGGELRQLLGKRNSALGVDNRDVVTGALRQAGVKVPPNYWGATDLRTYV